MTVLVLELTAPAPFVTVNRTRAPGTGSDPLVAATTIGSERDTDRGVRSGWDGLAVAADGVERHKARERRELRAAVDELREDVTVEVDHRQHRMVMWGRVEGSSSGTGGSLASVGHSTVPVSVRGAITQ